MFIDDIAGATNELIRQVINRLLTILERQEANQNNDCKGLEDEGNNQHKLEWKRFVFGRLLWVHEGNGGKFIKL